MSPHSLSRMPKQIEGYREAARAGGGLPAPHVSRPVSAAALPTRLGAGAPIPGNTYE